ncbi:MAG TPA: ABC transporter permease [Blastocatellia bacterium]|nr:ABC transporter permease [Blastocatellia bacterium]
MEALLLDIRYGFRMLRSKPGFTAVAIVALALGIGANSAIFSVVNAVLLRPLPYPDASKLAMIWGVREREGRTRLNQSYPDYEDYRDRAETLAYAAAYDESTILLTEGDEPEALHGLFASANIFPALGVAPLMGNAYTRDQDKVGAERVVVISYGLWRERFGSDPEIIGKEIRLGNRPYSVIGVMPAGFKFPADTSRTDFIMPFAPVNRDALTQRGNRFFPIVARLKPESSIAQARAEIEAISHNLQQQYPETNAPRTATVVALHDDLVGSIRPSLIVLLAAVGFVLLIACANVANLLLARAASRQKEIAIRTAVGASRWRIVRQLLTESMVLAVVGGGFGLLLALWGIDVLIAIRPANIPRLKEISLDPGVLGFTMAVSIVTGLIFGVAPALQASKPDLNETLKDGGRGSTGSTRRVRLRSLLVISEVALSLILLIGAGLLIKSFARVREVKLGFETHNVLTVGLAPASAKYPKPEDARDFFQQVIERASQLPGAQAAGVVNVLPLSGNNTATSFNIEGRVAPPGQEPNANYRQVSPDYFLAMGIPILKGRAMTGQDTKTGPQVTVINETFARRYFPDEDPIGKRVLIGDDDPQPREIVGIVGDVRHEGQDSEVAPEYYVSYLQDPARYMNLVLRSSSADSAGMGEALRGAIREVNKSQYIPQIQALDELLADTIAGRRFNMLLLGVFAALALILASVGIYGVMSYTVTERTHELGIRMALGARGSDVMKLVVGRGMAVALAGVAIGLVAAFALTRLMSDLLFGVSATDPLTFIIISVVLTGVALGACFVPARRATKVDPMVALRYE